MVIFNSYVSLPEGTNLMDYLMDYLMDHPMSIPHHWHWCNMVQPCDTRLQPENSLTMHTSWGTAVANR